MLFFLTTAKRVLMCLRYAAAISWPLHTADKFIFANAV
jgi:hypothetical protein